MLTQTSPAILALRRAPLDHRRRSSPFDVLPRSSPLMLAHPRAPSIIAGDARPSTCSHHRRRSSPIDVLPTSIAGDPRPSPCSHDHRRRSSPIPVLPRSSTAILAHPRAPLDHRRWCSGMPSRFGGIRFSSLQMGLVVDVDVAVLPRLKKSKKIKKTKKNEKEWGGLFCCLGESNSRHMALRHYVRTRWTSPPDSEGSMNSRVSSRLSISLSVAHLLIFGKKLQPRWFPLVHVYRHIFRASYPFDSGIGQPSPPLRDLSNEHQHRSPDIADRCAPLRFPSFHAAWLATDSPPGQ